MKLKNANFIVIKILIFLEDVHFDNMLISHMISSLEKNYKYFTGYMDDVYKIKPFSVILPKMSGYGKCLDMHFLIEDEELLKKHNMLFGINSTIVLKKNLMANPSAIKNFLKV